MKLALTKTNLFVCVTIIHSGAFKLLHWNNNLVKSWFWKVCVAIYGSSVFWRTVPILIQQICFLCHISRKHEIFLVNASLSIKNSCAKTNDKRHHSCNGSISRTALQSFQVSVHPSQVSLHPSRDLCHLARPVATGGILGQCPHKFLLCPQNFIVPRKFYLKNIIKTKIVPP